MKKDLVSIIIPTYNPGKYIFNAINSLLNQTYKNIEVIVVDDGSNDVKVKELLKDYIISGKINYFYKENSGPGSSRNYGVEKSNGEFVCFLDDDDEYINTRIELQLNEIKKGFDVVFCHGYEIDLNNIKNKFLFNFNKENINDINLLLKPFLYVQTVFIYKNKFIDLGGFDEKLYYFEDRLLFIKTLKKLNFSVVNYFLYNRFFRTGSLTQLLDYSEQEKDLEYFCNILKNDLFFDNTIIKKFISHNYFNYSVNLYKNGNRKKSLQYIIKSIKNNFLNYKLYIMLLLIFIPFYFIIIKKLKKC